MAHRMLQSVQYHSYYINLVQELSENDCRLRVNFVDERSVHWNRIHIFFWNVYFSEETTAMAVSIDQQLLLVIKKFLLILRDAQLASFGLGYGQIIGLHFFERTINGPIYLLFLKSFANIF